VSSAQSADQLRHPQMTQKTAEETRNHKPETLNAEPHAIPRSNEFIRYDSISTDLHQNE
jgi:hypothetical protein